MKLGRQGGASLPAQASSDMAEALQKGIASLAAKHGKDISQLHREEEAAENANAHPRSESPTASANRSAEPAAKQAWEAAKANYKAPSARAITQETFDEVVQENVEDFEMELKEAIADACLQFMKQGVNLNNIIKTEAHFNVKNKDVSDHVVTIALTTVKDAVVAKDSLTAEGMDNVCAALSDLRSAFEIDEEVCERMCVHACERTCTRACVCVCTSVNDGSLLLHCKSATTMHVPPFAAHTPVAFCFNFGTMAHSVSGCADCEQQRRDWDSCHPAPHVPRRFVRSPCP